MSDLITKEMVDYFKYRTGYHLWCVHKWTNRIAELRDPRINIIQLIEERDSHDEFKWIEPEYTPYVLITWNYKCKRDEVDFNLPDDIKEKMHEATFHHIKNHRHHPEYWDDNVTIAGLNKDDRDRPSKGQMVDGTKMPMTYVAAMVADWFAMSEELGGHPARWAADNINIRWTFTNAQIGLINDLIQDVWGAYDPTPK